MNTDEGPSQIDHKKLVKGAGLSAGVHCVILAVIPGHKEA